ncbi:MAG: phosphoribosylanthranilate isomerase [Terriglobales bacterium]
MTWIKICGTTNLDDAKTAVAAGADALGFIFAESPRRITPEKAAEIIAELPREVGKVGVFVNESPQRMHELICDLRLTAVQLQGDETMDVARELRRLASDRTGRLRIFKAVGVGRGMEGVLRGFAGATEIDGVLLDSFAARAAGHGEGRSARGGTGKTFDWRRAQSFVPGLAKSTRVIIAGGLSPENVAEAIAMLSPWGVDVCTGVEKSPGLKDAAKVREFIESARAAGASKNK